MNIAVLIMACLFLQCTQEPNQKNRTYIGGQIINPTTSKVVLQRGNQVIDSASLDSNNRFLMTFDSIPPGIYKFINHEYQNIYLEPGDSIMLRVNSRFFDESLSFSGRGAAKNTFIMNLFLHNEKENKNVTKLYQRSPKVFLKALDSMLDIRVAIFEKFLSKHTVSKQFYEIAEASVYYDNYIHKEAYPFNHYGRDKSGMIATLPKGFYRFRESINLNNKNLANHLPYLRYLIQYFDHKAYLKYCDREPYKAISFTHNMSELNLINELIELPELKDKLMRNVAHNFIANNNNRDETAAIFQLFLKHAESEKSKTLLKKKYQDNKRMEAGNVIPDQFVVTTDKRVVALSSIITKPTVLYFWSRHDHDYTMRIQKKIASLRKLHPQLNFIGINTDADIVGWTKAIKHHNYDTLHEFQFTNSSDARAKLVLNAPNKTILLDRNGTIVNSHSSIFHIDFEKELSKL